MKFHEYIRSMSVQEFAEFLVRSGYLKEFDYEFDGESEHPVDKYYEGYTTTDGKSFYTEEDAVKHQIEILENEKE